MNKLITIAVLFSLSVAGLNASSYARWANSNYLSPDYVSRVRKATSDCRSAAVALQQQASNCRQTIAADPKKMCAVKSGASTMSIEAADSLALSFLSTASQLEGQIPNIQAHQLKVNADESAIRGLGFDRTAKEFEEWEALAEKDQNEFIMKLTEVALGNVLVGGSAAVARAKSLNPFNAQKLIGKLKIFKNAELNEAIRRLALSSAKDKAVWIKDWQKVLHFIKEQKDLFFLGAGVAMAEHIDRAVVLEAIASALLMLVHDPVLELIVLNGQILAAYVYASQFSRELDDLTKLEGQNLATLRDLKKRTEDDWRDLKGALSTLPRPCSLG